MKKVIRCGKCTQCAKILPAGFMSDYTYFCLSNRMYVTCEDGCTFGSAGENTTGTVAPDVELGHDAAVKGYHW